MQADVGIRHKKYCSSIADFLAQLDKTSESSQRPLRERLTLCVEGNISAGKSTFLQALVADSFDLQDQVPFSVGVPSHYQSLEFCFSLQYHDSICHLLKRIDIP